MKEIINSRLTYYVLFALSYIIFSKFLGFEDTVLMCMGFIIGEQVHLQYLNQNKDDRINE
jgi:hypothetical protein